MKKNLASIIITNYNKEKFVKRSVQSALNQNYKNKKIIFFDDKSVDNSLKIVKKFSKIILINNKSKQNMKNSTFAGFYLHLLAKV